MKSTLAEAADKAHRLAKALRMKGYEAYEFHDRYASIVTVGSFNSVGTPRPDGRMEINAEIAAVMKTFGTDPDSREELDRVPARVEGRRAGRICTGHAGQDDGRHPLRHSAEAGRGAQAVDQHGVAGKGLG